MNSSDSATKTPSRRGFLKCSGSALAAGSLFSAIAARSFAGEDNTIKVGLVGCGGRGTGAAVNALRTKGPTRLVAMADVFEDRLESSYGSISKAQPKQVDVPKDRRFLGMDGYKKVIDTLGPGGVVLLATPPAFRPLHLEYAVAKGCHVFMEKSFAVDAPGIRRVLKAGKEAEAKNLKIAGGLMSRHNQPLAEAIEQIHNGAIGDVITCWAYREHNPVGANRFNPYIAKQASMNEMAYQIRNYSCFTWLNGSFILDWLIHNLDVCCWSKNAWPTSAQGQGGRQVRTDPDQLFDHYAVEYTFPDGTRMFAQGRHMNNCWNFFGDVIHGSKGSAVIGEGIANPKIYKGYSQKSGNLAWQYKGPKCNPYQFEHDLLFEAIRQDKPYNETERSAMAAMTGILGRMAAESGKLITWDEAFASNRQLAPNLEQMTVESTPPVVPDTQGRYPVAMPGITEVL